MREKYEYKQLGEITETINGLWTGKKPPFVNIAVVRNTNFTKDCKLNMSDVAYIDVEEKQYKSRKLQCGDIIIEKSGGSDKQPVGRPVLFNILDGEYSFSNFTATLRIIDKEQILPYFLHYCLHAKYLQGVTRKMQSKTTGLHNLDFKAYRKIEIPIPSISKQETIVSELDLINELIAKKKTQLADLDSLAQSLFYEMFGDPVENQMGWEVNKLENYCSTITKGTTPTSIGFNFTESGVNFVKVESFLADGSISKDNVAHISQECNSTMSRSQLKEKDILICIAGATVGKLARVDKSIIPANTNQACAIIRLKNEKSLINSFLYGYFKYAYIELVVDSLKKGVAQPNLSLGQIRQFDVFLPPLSLQQSFASRIDAIEEEKQKIQSSLQDLETLLASRMQFYFD